jgi:L-ribulose-5-phosphate 3-epimerase UlaE
MSKEPPHTTNEDLGKLVRTWKAKVSSTYSLFVIFSFISPVTVFHHQIICNNFFGLKDLDNVSEYRIELFERLLRTQSFDGKKHFTQYHFHEEIEDSDSFLALFFNQFFSPEDFEECFDLLQDMKKKKDYNAHRGYIKHDFLDSAFENFKPL